jgi:hypothetical protein
MNKTILIGDKTIDDEFFILKLPIIVHADETEAVSSVESDIFWVQDFRFLIIQG